MVLRLGNHKGDISILPSHHRSKPDGVRKHRVCVAPTLQVFDGGRFNKLDRPSELRQRRISPQIDDAVSKHRGSQTKPRRLCDFDHLRACRMQLNRMFGAKVEIGIRRPKIPPTLGLLFQDSKFASDSNRLFGFVFEAAGPVVPRTFVVALT